MSDDLLKKCIENIIAEHNGLRAAARHLQCDPAYLLRLYDGEKKNPGDKLLSKLGLKKVITYVRI